MKIILEIPEEFEQHYNYNRFIDSMGRMLYDLSRMINAEDRSNNCISWTFDLEVLDMLTKSIIAGTPLPKGHGRLIDAKDVIENICEEIGCTGDKTCKSKSDNFCGEWTVV